jgi:hypothetical protein
LSFISGRNHNDSILSGFQIFFFWERKNEFDNPIVSEFSVFSGRNHDDSILSEFQLFFSWEGKNEFDNPIISEFEFFFWEKSRGFISF